MTRQRRGSAAATVADVMIGNPKVSDSAVTVRDLWEFFLDEHVDAALLVDDGALVAVVERADLDGGVPGDALARWFGRLDGRVVSPETPLEFAQHQLQVSGRRRLAVVDASNTLLGLLCLKRSRTGFCSDADVAARARLARLDQ